jgi:hypothetical protein
LPATGVQKPKPRNPKDCGVFDLVAGTGFEPVTFRL